MPRRAFGIGLAMVIVAVVLGGCEAIVSSQLPAYACTGTDPSSCPAGAYCSQGVCVPCDGVGCGGLDAAMDSTFADGQPADAGGDNHPTDGPGPDHAQDSASADGSGDGPTEGPEDATTEGGDGGCGGAVGCACSGPSECASGICGDSETFGATFTAAHGFLCTTTCCTSADCPMGYVCFGPGNAGSYCVLSTDVGAPLALGSALAGAACLVDGDCRSGSCAAGRCVDLCCSDADCATGTSCGLDISGVNGHESFACLATTGGASHASCSTAAQCATNVCELDTCRGRCCGAASCMVSSFYTCTLDSAGTDVVYDCDITSPPGGAVFGGACAHPTDCASRDCNTATGTCTDACCIDADCATYGNYDCRPSTVAPYNLICTAP